MSTKKAIGIPKKDIWVLLRNRFPSNEFALLSEVRDRAGFAASRSADGIAVNLWPSRGLEIEGIEIKSSRGDWLRELKNPKKAEKIFQFCDRWWLVADGPDIVKMDEVPKTWGLMVAHGNRLHYDIPAPKLTPIPIDRHFLAAMLKRATMGMIPRESIEAELDAARIEATENEKRHSKYDNDELARLKSKLREFEDRSGLMIDTWDADRVGDAVRFIADGGMKTIQRDLVNLKSQSERIVAQITSVLSEIKEEAA